MILIGRCEAPILAAFLSLGLGVFLPACAGSRPDDDTSNSDALRRCGGDTGSGDATVMTPAPSDAGAPDSNGPGTPGPSGPAPAGQLFASGWENRTELGCTDAALLDDVWGDYGGSGACSGTVHDADIVSDVHHDGGRSLRVTQKTGNINGTDFRIVKVFGDQAEVTLTAWVRYASNYRWATADHKIFIFTDAGETAQNVYLNSRGQAGDPTHTRLLLASIPAGGTVFSDATPSHLMTTGVWYRIRVHLVAGQHGRMEAWLTPDGQPEMKLALSYEAGPSANIDDLPVGSIGGVKADSTYNLGSFITEPMYQWYDTVALYRGLYTGP